MIRDCQGVSELTATVRQDLTGSMFNGRLLLGEECTLLSYQLSMHIVEGSLQCQLHNLVWLLKICIHVSSSAPTG